MNPFLLWVPGMALIVAGMLLLVLQAVTWPVAVAIIVLGLVAETAGVLLWLRSRAEAHRQR